MIRLEAGEKRRVRVIGHLQQPALWTLLETIPAGPVVLDLSDVARADESAVRLLAGLPPERWQLARCPPWLALWIERVSRSDPERAAGDTPRNRP